MPLIPPAGEVSAWGSPACTRGRKPSLLAPACAGFGWLDAVTREKEAPGAQIQLFVVLGKWLGSRGASIQPWLLLHTKGTRTLTLQSKGAPFRW